MSFAALARKGEAAAPESKTKTASTGLLIGEPNDSFELEADRVADQVIAGGATVGPEWSLSKMSIGSHLQRKCACGGSGECEECKGEKALQRKAAGSQRSGYAPPIVHEVLSSPGTPLDQATRSFFEHRFGHAFSAVRVHEDSTAAESARAVQALAYTVGNHIVFGGISTNRERRKLLAHELAHTVQQEGMSSCFANRPDSGEFGDSHQHRAEAATGSLVQGRRRSTIVGGHPLELRGLQRPRLQRLPDPYAGFTIEQLREKQVTDPEAAEALRLRFRSMSNVDLERYARNDPTAQSVYAQRNIVAPQAKYQGRFSKPDIENTLEQDIQQQRTQYEAESGVTRSAPNPVAPGGRTEGGTMGSARTDIPGLEGRSFIGRSPAAGGQVNPNSQFAPPTDPEVLPHTHGHAEQGIADELEAELRSITSEHMRGRRVWILIEQEPCSTCAQGVAANTTVEAGVLGKLSRAFPEIIFEVRSLANSAVIVLKGGIRVGSPSPAAVAGSQSAPAGPPSASSEAAPRGKGQGSAAGSQRTPGGPPTASSEAAPTGKGQASTVGSQSAPAGPPSTSSKAAPTVEGQGSTASPGETKMEGALKGASDDVASAGARTIGEVQVPKTSTEIAAKGGVEEMVEAGTALRIAMGVAELSVLIVVGLFFDWLGGLVEQAMIERDVRALGPQIQDRLKGLGPEITELQQHGQVYCRIIYDLTRKENLYWGISLNWVDVTGKNLGNSQHHGTEVDEDGRRTEHYLQTVSTLIDDPPKRERERQNAALAEHLRRVAPKTSQPQPPPPQPPPSQPGLQPLLPLQAAPSFDLPGPAGTLVPGTDPGLTRQQVEKLVADYKALALSLLAWAEKLTSSSHDQAYFNNFKSAEHLWRTGVTLWLNYFTDKRPDPIGYSGMNDLLHSSQYGDRLKEILRNRMGG